MNSLHIAFLLGVGYGVGAFIEQLASDPYGEWARVFHVFAGVTLAVCTALLVGKGW